MSKKDKEHLNKLRQVKDVVYKASHNVNYKYVTLSYEALGRKVLELRKKYPNDQEFGQAVNTLLLENRGCPTYPGIQNL